VGTYQEDIAQSSDDAGSSIVGYDHVAETHKIAMPSGYVTHGWRFQSVPISQGVYISSAYIKWYGTHKCSPGCCWIQAWGVDEDDVATWNNPLNQPHNAAKTSARSEYYLNSNMLPDSLYASYEVDVTEAVQEIVDRAGWSSGNDLAILCLDYGSSGKGSNITVWTYDNTVGKPKPRLTIVYASDQTLSMDTLSVGASARTMAISSTVATLMDALQVQAVPKIIGISISPVARVIPVAALTGQIAPADVTVAPGSTTALVDALSIVSSAASVAIIAGARIIGCSAAAAQAVLRNITIQPSGATVSLALTGIASEANVVSVAPGQVNIQADAAAIACSLPAPVVTASVTIQLAVGACFTLPQRVAIGAGNVQVTVDAAALVIDPETLAAIPGTIGISLDALEVVTAIPSVSCAPGPASVMLRATILSGAANLVAMLPGQVATGLTAVGAVLGPAAVEIAIAPIPVQLSAVSAALLHPQLVVAPGQVILPVDAATAHITPVGVSAEPGMRVIAIEAVAVSSQCAGVTILVGTVARMMPASLSASAAGIELRPGTMTVMARSAVLVGSAPDLAVWTVTFPEGRMAIVFAENRTVAVQKTLTGVAILVDGQTAATISRLGAASVIKADRVFAISGDTRMVVVSMRDEAVVAGESGSAAVEPKEKPAALELTEDKAAVPADSRSTEVSQ
jgi:hypothetical protein